MLTLSNRLARRAASAARPLSTQAPTSAAMYTREDSLEEEA